MAKRAWSCDEKGRDCRNPFGCHCKEIAGLVQREASLRLKVEELERKLKEAMKDALLVGDQMLAQKFRADRLEDQNRALEAALTPSAETKAAYIGEFKFPFTVWDPHGEFEITHSVAVPWTTIKEIMKAIKARALASIPGEA